MLIKSADDRTSDIRTLHSLLARPDTNGAATKKIEREIRNISSGAKGEKDAAYEINFHYEASKNWAVLHDLRLEHEGRVAQIDHILINRFFEVWVCESKRFAEGIAINEQGECAMFWNGKAQGIGSPHEQNAKHMAVLKALCDAGVVDIPKRLGFSIKPSHHGLVVVSKNARITRPKAKGWWDGGIVKADQVKAKIDKTFDDNNILLAAKIVSSETLETFARGLASQHRPASFDWHAVFGLPTDTVKSVDAKLTIVPKTAKEEANAVADTADAGKLPSKLACVTCGEIVAYNVAKFCWFNKAKFGGAVYCMECQKKA